VTQRCGTCRHWVEKEALDYYETRWIHVPEGWKVCAMTATNWSLPHLVGERRGESLAVAVETDMSLGVLATASEFGCVQWDGQHDG